MLVEGEMLVIEFLENDQSNKIVLGPGQTIKIPKSTKHAFIPVTDCKFISFCTKPWHLCHNPITKI
jgi:mannose-6-phosphate isomerase-like protein (cupin superfamily)